MTNCGLRRLVQLLVVAVFTVSGLSCVPETQEYGGYRNGSGYDRGYESDSEMFHDALAPYGNWVDHETYGRVWYPNNVPSGWRPYTDGRWEYSPDYGWVWASDWAWGWAPFHYGRWAFDDWYGWVWVPGRVWAPAWVFWRYGGGYAAWAPMPPTVYWRAGRGLDRRHFRHDRDLRWDSWVCVPERHLHGREMRRHIASHRDNVRLLERTTTMVQVVPVGNRVVNQGVPIGYVEKLTGRPVTRVRLHEVGRPDGRADYQDRNGLRMVRPRFRPESSTDLEREEERAVKASRMMEQGEQARSRKRGSQDRFEPRKAGRFDEKTGTREVRPAGGEEGQPVSPPAEVRKAAPPPRSDEGKRRERQSPPPQVLEQQSPATVSPAGELVPQSGDGRSGEWGRGERRDGDRETAKPVPGPGGEGGERERHRGEMNPLAAPAEPEAVPGVPVIEQPQMRPAMPESSGRQRRERELHDPSPPAVPTVEEAVPPPQAVEQQAVPAEVMERQPSDGVEQPKMMERSEPGQWRDVERNREPEESAPIPSAPTDERAVPQPLAVERQVVPAGSIDQQPPSIEEQPRVMERIEPEPRRESEREGRGRRPDREQPMRVESPAPPEPPQMPAVEPPQAPALPDVPSPRQEERSREGRQGEPREPFSDVQPRESVAPPERRMPGGQQEEVTAQPQSGQEEQSGDQDKRKKKRRGQDGSEEEEPEDQPRQ